MYRIVIESEMKSAKTNVSLYNEQLADAYTMCHSVGVKSSTPSIQIDKDGVSVENVHTHSKQWFVQSVSYGRRLKAKEIIDAHNIQSKFGDC